MPWPGKWLTGWDKRGAPLHRDRFFLTLFFGGLFAQGCQIAVMTGSDPDWAFAYERSARRDLRFWALLLLGAAFAYAGFTIDPQTNCSESGECAPWLGPVAAVIGLGAMAMGAGALLANAGRGCRFDPASGELIWWQNRTRTHAGDGGRIAPAEISCVRLDRDSDSAEIHLYDQAGDRLPFFDSEVIPFDHEAWARDLIAHWPHIVLKLAA